MSSQVSLVNFCALKVDALHWCSHLFNGWHMCQNMWDVTQTNCSTFISKKLFVWYPSISGMANSKTFLASCKIRKYAVQCQCEPFCIFKCVHSRRRNFTFDLKENFPSFQCTWELSFNLIGKYAALPFNHLIFLQWIIICCDRAVEKIRLSWGNLNDPFILKYPRKIYLRDCYLLDYYEFPYTHTNTAVLGSVSQTCEESCIIVFKWQQFVLVPKFNSFWFYEVVFPDSEPKCKEAMWCCLFIIHFLDRLSAVIKPYRCDTIS